MTTNRIDIAASRPVRRRRSCLTVPGSNPRMLQKSKSLAADEVILDLEDSVAPSAKEAARENIVAALAEGGWGEKTVAVRVNEIGSPWHTADIADLVTPSITHIDVVMLPKVADATLLAEVDRALSEAEAAASIAQYTVGLEIQIEDPLGLSRLDELIEASPRVETLVFGPGDFMASMQLPSLTIGVADGAAGLVVDSALVQLAFAARRHGIQVIDGPYAVIDDIAGFDRAAQKVAALGFDGKWVLHPAQVERANIAFTPDEALFTRAQTILEAYSASQTEAGRGAAMFDGEMIDEATRKMAESVVARGGPRR